MLVVGVLRTRVSGEISDGPPVTAEGPALTDATVRDLPSHLRPGDLLVVNDVRVHAARLRARRGTGGEVEVLLVRPAATGGATDVPVWEALVRPSRRLQIGERLSCGVGSIVIMGRLPSGAMLVKCAPDVAALTTSAGEVPLPPYMDRRPTAEDVARYQTVYARGATLAAAAPTAGLHPTERLLAEVDARGVERVSVTLEVGLGTFQPLRAEQIERGRLHEERYFVPTASWHAVQRARRDGRRVIAVGTTTVRVLESMVAPGAGETTIFIREGHAFRHVDALLTNFHLPRSSLLMLVSAFGGRQRVRAAYEHALQTRYRFYSYGDSMFLTAAHADGADRAQS